MRDLNRRNEFAWKSSTGRYFRLGYSEAWARLKQGEEVYERILPDCSITVQEKARIPWTLVNPNAEET
jgi:hypothetical protein